MFKKINAISNMNMQSSYDASFKLPVPNFSMPFVSIPSFEIPQFKPFKAFQTLIFPGGVQNNINYFNNNNLWAQAGMNFQFNTNFDTFNFSGSNSYMGTGFNLGNISFNSLPLTGTKSIKDECYSPQTGFSLESAKIDKLYTTMGLDKKGLNKQVFIRAIEGYNNLSDKGNGLLGIFDTTQNASKERYYLIDLNNFKLIGQTVIKEGSGDMSNIATANKSGSHATLSGFEKVGTSYKSSKSWEKGIYLHGLEKGINDSASARGCVAHYTTNNTTWGCKGISAVIENGQVNKEKTFEKLEKFFPKDAIVFTYPKDQKYWEMSELYS